MADINFNTVSVVSAINNSDHLHITTGGSHRRVLVSKLVEKAKADALTSVEANMLDRLTSGCFVMSTHNNGPVAYPASLWTQMQNSGNVATGVLVVEGSRHIVVAPTMSSSTITWASSAITVNPNFVTDRKECFTDFEGEAKTSALLANGTIGGDGPNYAPGFCAAYSYGAISSGGWWLPSIGELLMMWSNKSKINTCLSLISDGVALSDSTHLSSTESSNVGLWTLSFYRCIMSTMSKIGGQGCVRPVSAFRI